MRPCCISGLVPSATKYGSVGVCVCVCVRACVGGTVFFLGSSFFICFFRQKAAIVFHSLKAKVFLCGNEGEGTESFLVNNVERSLHFGFYFNVFSSFHLLFHLLFRCVWKNLICFL